MRQRIASTSLWFTMLSLAASALNFAYYPIISRFLDLAQFGDVQIGLAFVMQAAALFSSLNLVALYVSTSKQTSKNITSRLERIIILPSVLGSMLVVLFATPISQLLQLHDASLLYLLAIIFILNIPAGTWLGTLQGEGSFARSGWISLIASLIKIISSALLILCGFGAHGAIIGIIIGTSVIVPLCFIGQKEGNLNIRHTFRLPEKNDFRYLLNHKPLVAILTVFVLLSLMSTFDTLFAKITLNPTEAGVFSQLSTIAKIPYFLLLPVSMILFRRFITEPRQQTRVILSYCVAAIIVSLGIYLTSELLGTLLFNLPIDGDSHSIAKLLLLAFCAFIISNLFIYVLVSRAIILKALLIVIISFVGTFITLRYATDATDIAARFALLQILTSLLLSFVVLYTRGNANQISHPVSDNSRI